jgi:hypothetical protein
VAIPWIKAQQDAKADECSTGQAVFFSVDPFPL